MHKNKVHGGILLLAVCGIWAGSALLGEDGGSGTVTVSVTSLTFNSIAGGSGPAPQKFTVTASRSTRFSVSASAAGRVNWLSISPVGNLATNQTITVSVVPASLTAGTYTGSILITSGGRTQTIPVTLIVTASKPPPSSLTVIPSALVFSATSGGASPPNQTISVTASSATTFSARASGTSGGTTWLNITPSGSGLVTNTSISVSISPGSLAAATYSGTITLTASGSSTTVPVSLVITGSGGTPPPTAGYHLIGWNDLGMHCFDGADYSVFAVLPPYNTIHAHLIDSNGNLVTAPTGYTVTYQAISDPLTNTINTTSVGKTNFWQYSQALGFGNLAPDTGLKGNAMPGAANTPQGMTFTAADNTWLAVGIPITPYADSNTTSYPVNYFPMMRLTAKNSSGTVLASTDIVLPISDEMACGTCHNSSSVSAAAKPAAGWVNLADPAKDMKVNMLRKHDDRFQSSTIFQNSALAFGYSTAGLEATYPNKPILCATCHASNALGLAGYPGIPPLTTSVHGKHASAIDPVSGQTLDAGTTRTSCYNCHPGAKTQCLRGAMATLKDGNGVNEIECQSCHGNMSAVGNAARQGWLSEPACQMCHTGTALKNNGQIVYTSAFDATGAQRIAADQTFATNPNTPASGISLYRYSSGHGGLQCEACHNSTHAEYASSIVNDNVQSTNLQGHSGMISECSACHSSVPSTVTGGPHGMHPIGSSWVSQHQDVADNNGATQCQTCHGSDYKGTILSKTKADRTLAGRSFPAGTIIGCYSCHNGPGGGG